MPLRAPHFESMVEAIVVVSHPAAGPTWALTRLAGLPAIERNLMGLRRAGVARVRVECGPSECAALAAHFERRIRDARLPAVTVVRQGADGPTPCTGAAASCGARGGPALVLDGRCVYHPERLRRMLPGSPEGEVAGLYCEDITTPAGRRRASRAIRASLRKPTDGWFARRIDRSVSLAISAVLAPFPIHPDAVTIGTLFVGVAACVVAARGTYTDFVIAAALFLLASVLDGVDGELARMKFQGTRAGEWLDTVCDDLTNALYLAGVTAGAWRALSSRLLLWTGVAAVVLDIVVVSFLYWQLITRVNGRTLLAFEETILAPALRQAGVARFVARLQPLMKRDLYAPLFLVFALVDVAWLALPATAIGLATTLVFVLRDFVRARRAEAGVRAA